jgi:exosome complex component RRP45
MRIVGVGVERVRTLDELVERRLKEDWAGRVVEVR